LESSFVPNIASAKKNMRKSRAATVRNRAQRSALRTALKKANDPASSAEVKLAATKLLDRAARKGLIHANNAARHKSRLSKANA
jgi:small subunit ribosomal protein S20